MTALCADLLQLLVKYARVDADDRPTAEELDRFAKAMRAWRVAYNAQEDAA